MNTGTSVTILTSALLAIGSAPGLLIAQPAAPNLDESGAAETQRISRDFKTDDAKYRFTIDAPQRLS